MWSIICFIRSREEVLRLEYQVLRFMDKKGNNTRKEQTSFDFQKELASAITAEELKKRTISFLKPLEFKK